MTYSRHTRKYACDVCHAEPTDQTLHPYFRIPHGRPVNPTQHLCLACLRAGAYYCPTCEKIHTSLQECKQKTFLNTLPETWPPPV